MRAEARDLVAAACRRLLSPEEARCLAIQAAKDSIGIQRDNGGLSVDTLEGGRPGEAHFIVTYHLRGQPAVSARSFIVDLESWQLWDAHTFTPFRSEGVGRLASMMASARSEPALSPEDILQIALRTPRVTSRLSTGCSGLVVGGEGTSAATYVGLRGCPGSFGTSETSVAVDTHTGVVTDPRTGKQVDAPDATRLAADLVREQTRRHLEVVEGLKAACPVN
jgi:hypothetical protein